MKLDHLPFERIQEKEKNIELRLNDEKRRLLEVGDTIVFKDNETGEQIIKEVIQLLKGSTFNEILNTHQLKLQAGFNTDDDIDIVIKKYYSDEQVRKYGVLGIVLDK